MDVDRTMQGENELDARQQLEADLDSVRAEADGIERAIAGNQARIEAMRTSLDAMAAAIWRDVFAQQQRARRDDIWAAALKLEWLGTMQFLAIGLLLVIAAATTLAFHVAGAVFSACVYGAFLIGGYFTSRDQVLTSLKKARKAYLGDDGRDIRFVAFTHTIGGVHHPLVGFDGPLRDGTFADRSWKIPGVRDDEALKEVFVEVVDDRQANVLLTRFPEKKPTLVHADLENPFIRAYGVFFQRALERRMPTVAAQAEEFRIAVLRVGERKKLAQRISALETELREVDGTRAIMSDMPLSITLRNKLLKAVVQFRMGEPVIRGGTMLFATDGFDIGGVVETLARASAATFLPFSFSSLKIGYVGQGAAQVARTFDGARRARSIIFIEDGDKLFNNTGTSGFEPMRREIQQAILKGWDASERSDMWVIAAVCNRDSIDPTVLAHFGTLIDLTPPARDESAPTMESMVDRPIFEDPTPLPQDALEKLRVLSAMFAHVETMERQGISVPRGVLVSSPSGGARRSAVASLASQSGLTAVHCNLLNLDEGMAQVRAAQPAMLVVEVPKIADPGPTAHLCILIDELSANQSEMFIVVAAENPAALDQELLSRFGEVIDIPGLDSDVRREKLLDLVTGKPLDFDFEEHLDEFERATVGMSEDCLHAFVESAIGRAAMRAIGLGKPDHVRLTLDDFERLDAEPQTAA